MDEGQTHFFGDDCPGGHLCGKVAYVNVNVGVALCTRPEGHDGECYNGAFLDSI